jgi:G3E family GTPase
MAREIYIISGFLGAGKTTLIQKLLRETFQDKKVALIENDFGEISIDASLMRSGGVEVKEINSGCICCSLSGDFVKALRELLTRYEPDIIIIEPSGVGKLSDIVKACSDPACLSIAAVKSAITVVDVKRCKMYLENFGEFFEDQIKHATTVLFSRISDCPEKIDAAVELIEDLNENAVIITKPWSEMTATEILQPVLHPHDHEEHCCCGHHDHSHSHDHCHSHDHDEDSCGCDHSAEDVFDTVTVRTNQIFSMDELNTLVKKMENTKGTILRAKGIVRSINGYINLQYLPGDIRITDCAVSGDILNIIGNNLDKQELSRIINGE